MVRKAATFVIACVPLLVWAQEPPIDPEAIRSQACAAPNRMENDEAAKERLYLGIGIYAAICVAGAPAARQVSNGGQSVDALEYADGASCGSQTISLPW